MTIKEFQDKGYILTKTIKVFQDIDIEFEEVDKIKGDEDINNLLTSKEEVVEEFISDDCPTYTISLNGEILEYDILEFEIMDRIKEM